MADETAGGSAELERAREYLVAFGARLGTATSLEEERAAYEEFADQFPLPSDTETEWVNGDALLRVRAPGASDRLAVLDFHGGGYRVGSAWVHREIAARLSAASGATVYTHDYPRAPESPFPAQIESSLGAYRYLLEEGIAPTSIGLSGVSAGGNMTLVLPQVLRSLALPQPAALVAISPWGDLESLLPSHTDRAERDPFLGRDGLLFMAEAYLDGHDPKDPLASPIYADFTGFPPTLIQVGTEETLFDEAVGLTEGLEAAGVDATLTLYPGAAHIWQHFGSFLPEARQSIEEAAAFFRAHWR